MTKTILIALVALVAALAIPSAASAAGACGGGKTFDQMYNGWKKKGVLDDVYREAGIKPGVDAAKGAASKALLKKAFVRKRVVRGTSRARNTDCVGGKFDDLSSRARQSSGTYVWVLKDDISKSGVVKTWWAADCGNKRGGWIKVHMPGKKPPKKPKPPKTNGKYICANTGVMVDSIQQCVTQTNTASQNCEAGQIWNGTQCTIVQVNNNCGNTSVGTGNTATGDNCNVVNVCSNVNSPGGVIICTTPPPPPPPPGEDAPPQITCVFPAHVLADGGSVQIWCEASDPDGDAVSINVISSDTYGHISGTIINSSTTPVPRYDGSPCPASVTCSRSTYWGDQITPTGVLTTIVATATANGKSATSVGRFPIRSGNLGF